MESVHQRPLQRRHHSPLPNADPAQRVKLRVSPAVHAPAEPSVENRSIAPAARASITSRIVKRTTSRAYSHPQLTLLRLRLGLVLRVVAVKQDIGVTCVRDKGWLIVLALPTVHIETQPRCTAQTSRFLEIKVIWRLAGDASCSVEVGSPFRTGEQSRVVGRNSSLEVAGFLNVAIPGVGG